MKSCALLILLAAGPFIAEAGANDPPAPTENALTREVTQRDPSPSAPRPLMDYLSDELDYSMRNLVGDDGTKPYCLGYTVYDEDTAVVIVTLGALTRNDRMKSRRLNIDLRVGDYSLDNTHQIRGGGAAHASGSGNIPLALEDDEESIRHALWYHTDRVFKQAVKRFTRIETDLKVKVEEEDKSDDFSREAPQVHSETPASLSFDAEAWAKRLRRISAIARDYPLIYSSRLTIGAFAGTRYIVTSEGTRLQTASRRCRITMAAATKAEDALLHPTFGQGQPDVRETRCWTRLSPRRAWRKVSGCLTKRGPVGRPVARPTSPGRRRGRFNLPC